MGQLPQRRLDASELGIAAERDRDRFDGTILGAGLADDSSERIGELGRGLEAVLGLALQGLRGDALEGDLSVLKTLAREFDGDLSFDPYTTISGVERSWIFVRGDDLSLRVIAELDGSGGRAELLFDDRQLRDPQSIDVFTGARQPVVAGLRTLDGLLVRIDDPGSIALLSVERVTVEELGGQEERLEIAGGRQMPVEEILRRLQA